MAEDPPEVTEILRRFLKDGQLGAIPAKAAKRRGILDHLAQMKTPNRIRFLLLPTYAPWTNPAEKYWLKLSREWLRFHPFAGDKTTFKRELDGWLSRHSDESPALLHELGLLPD